MGSTSLLLGFADAGNNYPPRELVSTEIARINELSSIQLAALPMTEPRSLVDNRVRRLVFRLAGGVRDDAKAKLFAECILLASQYINGPIMEPDLDPSCLHFLARDFDNLEEIDGHDIESAYRAVYPARDDASVISNIYGFTSVQDFELRKTLRVGVALMDEADIRLSLAFLGEAQHSFYVWPGGLPDALAESDWSPETTIGRVRWETSFFNTYRAIEAIIGDPNKNDSKFRQGLITVGIDPDREVGYIAKEKIATVIRRMNDVRDKKVAHGSTKSRGVGLGEMTEYQKCASFIIQCVLEKRGVHF